MALIRLLKAAVRRVRPRPPAAPPPEINALIAGHLAGDPRAFDVLVARYQVRLINFVYRMLGDRERAEDLVQETFLRVHRHMHRFDRSRNFSTWIYTIAANLAKNEIRHRNLIPFVPFDALPPPGRAPAPEPDDPSNRPDVRYDRKALHALVQETLTQLPPAHREVFVLRELEGRSYEEIADVAHVSIGTVKSRLNRARHRFADLIQQHLR